MPEGYLTTTEFAERFHVKIDVVQKMCREGRIDCIRFGKQWRIPPDAVVSFETGAVPVDLRAAARTRVAEAVGAGRMPLENPPEVLGLIATILRQHYAEQADRDTG